MIHFSEGINSYVDDILNDGLCLFIRKTLETTALGNQRYIILIIRIISHFETRQKTYWERFGFCSIILSKSEEVANYE